MVAFAESRNWPRQPDPKQCNGADAVTELGPVSGTRVALRSLPSWTGIDAVAEFHLRAEDLAIKCRHISRLGQDVPCDALRIGPSGERGELIHEDQCLPDAPPASSRPSSCGRSTVAP